jgi:hypothetical protein
MDAHCYTDGQIEHGLDLDAYRVGCSCIFRMYL